MARVSPPIVNFTGGELSPKLWARVDVAKYQAGAKTIENFIVMPYGGATKRPGTRFNWYCRVNNENQRLQPFMYGADQAYMLLFSNHHIRIFTPDGIVTEAEQGITQITRGNPAVVTYIGADYANGDRVLISSGDMVELNNREFTVANVNAGANTLELQGINSSNYTPYTGGATLAKIVEIDTTYTSDEITDLSFTQSANTLFIAHRNHVPAKLTRTSDTEWLLEDFTTLRGPWRTLNKDATTTIESDNASGAVTLTASADVFDVDMVGGRFKLYSPTRTQGEAEWGVDLAVTTGDYWTYNGNVYRITSGGVGSSENATPPTHLEGTITLYALGAESGGVMDVLFLHQGFGIVDLTAFTSATEVTGTVYEGFGYNELPQQLVSTATRFKEATKFWQEGAWSPLRGYPAKITLFEQRLAFGSSLADQQTVWLSSSGLYNDFEEGAKDDQAINYTIGSDQADVIRWMVGGKAMRIGTTSGEYVLSSSSQAEAVTPSNIKVSRETTFGSSPMAPVTIGQAVIFGARNGLPSNPARVILESSYNFDINGFVAVPLTIWADHIAGNTDDLGITRMAYQARPDSLLWCCRVDGYAACLTYEREQQVTGWHRHFLGGWSNDAKTDAAIIEDVATMPGPDGDLLFLIVNRRIGGLNKRYVETLSHWDYNVTKADGVFLDCAITYDGPSITEITGLAHLEGETVQVLANGAKFPDVTVSGGKAVLASPGEKVHLGYKYKSILHTLDLEAGAQAGTAQGKAGQISEVVLRLHRSLGGTIGPDAEHQDQILYRTPSGAMDSSPALKTSDLKLKLEGGWADRREIHLEHDDPFNMTILGMFPIISTTG